MKQLVRLVGMLFGFGLPLAAISQPLPQYSAVQRARQAELLQTLTQTEAGNFARALTVAQRLNRPTWERLSNGTIRILKGISETGELLYDRTFNNARSAQTTRTTALYAGGSLGLSLSGSTLTDKLGVWDGSAIRTTHIEFAKAGGGSRVTQVDKSTAPLEEHSTHVAGTLIATGVNPQAKGMAFGTTLRAYDFNSDISEMTQASSSLLISNHSYSGVSGWQYNPDRTGTIQWEWWGDTTVSKIEDYTFGLYSSNARQWDQVVYNAPYYLPVKAAGNDHGSDGPAPGQPYYLSNTKIISTLPRNTQDGYDQIPANSTPKNILTVAAIDALANGYNQPSDVGLSDFTSWGPTDDGRIKPDISGVGVNVFSTAAANDSAYAIESGTSMASPNVAGSLLLLQELYSQRNSGTFMRASTLKGLALHTADEAGKAPGPDYRYGWGLLNMERAGQVLLNTANNHILSEQTLNQAETYRLVVTASGRGPLRTTICWTDPPGTAVNTLNNRSPRLVNDLDLRVASGPTTTLPWILNPDQPDSAATRGDNIRDNVEQVLVNNAVPGQSYTLIVTHKGNLTGPNQPYALLVSGVGGTTYCASAAGSPANSTITRVQLGSINQPGSGSCTTYSDFTPVSTTIQPGQTMPLSISTGSCGSSQNVIVKVFVDWNQDGTFTDANELMATSTVLLSGSGVFQTNLNIPQGLPNGHYYRMRIVEVETTNPNDVQPCGTYGAGETQDYTLQTIPAGNDVGVIAIESPEVNFCPTPNVLSVAVRVRNFGTITQTSIPVSVTVTNADGQVVATAFGSVRTLSPYQESVVWMALPATADLATGQTYRFTASAETPTDQNTANNTISETRTAANTANNGVFTANRCGNEPVYLRNAGGGIAYWFDQPTGGTLLAAGNQTSIPNPPAQLYAGLNELNAMLGPLNKNAFTGGTYSGNFGPSPLLDTQVPIILKSARLYIAQAGQITFTVRRLDNIYVSSTTLDVVPTRNTSLTAVTSNGQLPDDPADSGAVYTLNLKIPTAGSYKIDISYANGAAIFRSNAGVSGLPYQIKTQTGQPLVSIKGALFDNGTATDTIKTSWYYFYDLQVRSLDCPANARQAVPVTTSGQSITPTITANGSTSFCMGSRLTLQTVSEAGYTYQWYRDNVAISGATASTLVVVGAGTYSVQVASTCAPVRSAGVAVSVSNAVPPLVTVNGFVLTTNATSNIQWLLNGVPIPGATTQTYTVTQTGRYSVQGSVNGCGQLISDDVYLTILATETLSDAQIWVYPNPVSQQLTVALRSVMVATPLPGIRLLDATGRVLQTAAFSPAADGYEAQLDVSSVAAGMLFVEIADDSRQRVWVRKVIKR